MSKHDFSMDVGCNHCDRMLSEIVQEKQTQLQTACDLLAEIVRAYERMPDGPLPFPFTNGHFLRAREFVRDLKQKYGYPTSAPADEQVASPREEEETGE